MMRYRATLAYDGTAYEGFQRQAQGRPTIQGVVEQALAQVTGQPVTVIGAGRTDSGVHATGQVIGFQVEWSHGTEALLRAVNASLPPDIALQDLSPAPPGFHPRFSARSRLYRYDVAQTAQRQPLLWHRAWQVRGELDGAAMQQAASLLLGEHDFAAFGRPPHGDNTVRTVYRSEWTQQPAPFGTWWSYRIEANAFLQHMVRRVVGALVAVGQGRLTVADFESYFRRADLSGLKRLAPPQGLTLEAVRYEEVDNV
ncbi:MAG: tRNA pseudouridine(38-40) synthase TruA [Chloroflexi bacterium]|nr:tRNA pseudouridine(38-40) synthase TruA [Chloroflexota bacterium]